MRNEKRIKHTFLQTRRVPRKTSKAKLPDSPAPPTPYEILSKQFENRWTHETYSAPHRFDTLMR